LLKRASSESERRAMADRPELAAKIAAGLIRGDYSGWSKADLYSKFKDFGCSRATVYRAIDDATRTMPTQAQVPAPTKRPVDARPIDARLVLDAYREAARVISDTTDTAAARIAAISLAITRLHRAAGDGSAADLVVESLIDAIRENPTAARHLGD
jgi:hypothetical protein